MESTQEIFERIPETGGGGLLGFLLWAILIGLFLSVVVNMGPAFITLVQTSLHRGFRSAAWFAMGVILNDAMVVSVCILTSVQVVTHNGFESALACIGAGLIMVLFGVYTYMKKDKGKDHREEVAAKHSEEMLKDPDEKPAWYVFFGKGFALNVLNPFVWLLWFSAVAIAAGKMGGNKVNTIVFFAVILGTTFAMELLKAWGAAKLQKFLTPERMTMINRIAGVMLMLFGAYFIVFRGIVHL
ncbi:MAG: LysE family transporter [Bacteroidales bacterium]|nr:LysE family transporter [Bacteroidales bacterium]